MTSTKNISFFHLPCNDIPNRKNRNQRNLKSQALNVKNTYTNRSRYQIYHNSLNDRERDFNINLEVLNMQFSYDNNEIKNLYISVF